MQKYFKFSENDSFEESTDKEKAIRYMADSMKNGEVESPRHVYEPSDFIEEPWMPDFC